MIEHIARLDADVISIEASRSGMGLLDVFRDFEYWLRDGRHTAAPARPRRAFKETAGVYLINADNGFSRRGGHVFHLLLGGQRQPFGRWPSGVDPD